VKGEVAMLEELELGNMPREAKPEALDDAGDEEESRRGAWLLDPCGESKGDGLLS
jgi:hypothetical protein